MSVRQVSRRSGKSGEVSTFWMVDVVHQHPDGTVSRVRKVSPFPNRRAAEQLERSIRMQLLQGPARRQEEAPKGTQTLRELWTDFLNVHVQTENKPSEIAAKKGIWKHHLDPAFGSKPLRDIGAEDIARYKARKQQAGYGPKSINNQLAVLRRMLAMAVDWGRLERVPPLKWMRVPPNAFDFLSREEGQRLVAAAEEPWRTMILLGLRTGLRHGELLPLRWEDVDLVAGRLVVRRAVSGDKVLSPKNNRTREVPLSDDAVRALKAHRHLRGDLVFCQSDGRMFSRHACKWPLTRACKRAGLRNIGWHTLRHTFASHLVMTGAPLKVVQELLGHSGVTMTLRYAHLSPDVRRDAVQRLDSQSYGNLTATASASN